MTESTLLAKTKFTFSSGWFVGGWMAGTMPIVVLIVSFNNVGQAKFNLKTGATRVFWGSYFRTILYSFFFFFGVEKQVFYKMGNMTRDNWRNFHEIIRGLENTIWASSPQMYIYLFFFNFVNRNVCWARATNLHRWCLSSLPVLGEWTLTTNPHQQPPLPWF